MTTLREKIRAIIEGKNLPPFKDEEWYMTFLGEYIDKIMSAVEADNKRKYGWTDEDCPFSYGDEIEVSDDKINLYKAAFISFLPQCRFPYYARNMAGVPSTWSNAHPVLKQEVQTTTWQIELDKLLLNETILV